MVVYELGGDFATSEQRCENGSLQKVLKHELPTGEVNGSTNLLITLSYASVTIFSFVNGRNAS